MARPAPNRRNPGNKVSKLDRDTSKKNVAINKAQQKQELAAGKAFVQRQKQIKSDLAELEKLHKRIKAIIEKTSEDRKLDQQFLGQIKKFYKDKTALKKQLEVDYKSFEGIVEKPQMYSQVVAQASKVPNPSPDMTYGNASLMLGILIVILNRLLQMRAKK